MEDANVLRMLAELGMDDMSYRALAVLPLVQVAWADGEVQPAEQALILSTADERFKVGEEGRRLVDNWLRFAPSESYVKRGRIALATLVEKEADHGLGADVVTEVVELSRQVAKAAGGLFGLGAVSRQESAALEAIDTGFKGGPGGSGPKSAVPQSGLPEGFGQKGLNRVTITFATTITMDLGASSGVLEADPVHKLDGRFPVDRNGLTVGSGEQAELRVENDDGMAPAHARFHEHSRKYYVTALSDRPVTVNGERVQERRLLGGETVQIGHITLYFKLLRKIPKQLV
jgi:hypothetical protein